MEYTLLILLLLIMIWINLRNKISKSQEKTEELSKEIAALRRRLENSSEVADEIKEPEPETLKEPEVFVQPEPVKAIVEPARNLQPQKVRKPVNYEKYIGENLFGKIGILILVLGMGLFVKYAIDKEWINETLRTILGFGMGGLLLFVAWRLKDSYRTFSSLLAGGAFAIFYVTVRSPIIITGCSAKRSLLSCLYCLPGLCRLYLYSIIVGNWRLSLWWVDLSLHS